MKLQWFTWVILFAAFFLTPGCSNKAPTALVQHSAMAHKRSPNGQLDTNGVSFSSIKANENVFLFAKKATKWMRKNIEVSWENRKTLRKEH